jgi:diacylglycerol diphosphate phosphatase / phosphatidate phosphatase
MFFIVATIPSEVCVFTFLLGSFAGLGFLSWYLAGKITAFDLRGHVAKLCIVFLPLLTAALVAVSRVDDYWHHWQDVFTGAMIGLQLNSFLGSCGGLSFSHCDPFLSQVLQLLRSATCNFSHILMTLMVPPFCCHLLSFALLRCHRYACLSFAAFWPHAYAFQLAEERSSRNVNSYSVRPTEIETVNIPAHSGVTLRDTSPILEDMEGGRRL